MWTRDSVFYEDIKALDKADFIPWERLANKRILITGATGLVGYAVIRVIAYMNEKRFLGISITAVVRDKKKAMERFSDVINDATELNVIEASVESIDSVPGTVDYIIHGASPTSGKYFMSKPVELIDTAINGTKHMLDIAKKKAVSGFVYLSSMEMYGYPIKGTKVTEDMAGSLNTMDSRNSYPIAKQLCEQMCHAYAIEYGVPARMVRLTQTIGEHTHPDDKRIFAYFAQCSRNGEDIVLKTKGESERSLIFSLDAATAILTVLVKGALGQAYNVANDATYGSIADMARLIADESGVKFRIEDEDESKNGFPATIYMDLDTTLIRKLGWKPFFGNDIKISLEKSHKKNNIKAPLSVNFDDRKKELSKYIYQLSAYNVKLGAKNYNDFYFDYELEENSILIAGLGVSVRGNMQYVLNELNTDPYFEGYTIYVRTHKETDATVNEYIKRNGWKRTKTIPKNYGMKLETCKYLICESFFPYKYVKKPGQIVINLWHGTPIKKLGLEKNGKKVHYQGIQQKNFIYADYLLYPNEYTKKNMLKSYGVSELLPGKILMSGYPRTGGMLAVSKAREMELRKLLAPNGERIYAYMPTFRGILNDEESIKEADEFLTFMDENMPRHMLLYVNLHHQVNDGIDYSKYRRIRKFPPLIDTYELLAATDGLISDYSSVFFDYLALRKHIILYVYDYERYISFHGLYMNITDLPFDVVYESKDVISAIERGKTYDDTVIFNEICRYDDSDNAKRVTALISKEKTDSVIIDVEKNGKPNVLLFIQWLNDANTDAFIEEYITKEHAADNVYIACDSGETDIEASMEKAYPFLLNKKVIGTENGAQILLSSVGSAYKKLYYDGAIDFDKAIEVLRYEYLLHYKRMFGETIFDEIMIYNVYNPEILLSLVFAPAGRKRMNISPAMTKKIRTDRKLYDAVELAKRVVDVEDNSEYSSIVFPNTDKHPMFGHKYMSHAMGGIKEYGTFLNIREGFERAYKAGNRFFECDLRFTSDKKIVLTHGYNEKICMKQNIPFDESKSNMTYDEFMKLDIHGHKTMDLSDLKELLDYKDVYIELDIHKLSYEDTKDILDGIVKVLGIEKLDRCLVQIHNRKMYKAVKENGCFKHVQYVFLKDNGKLEKEFLWARENNICSVALKKSFITKEYVKTVKAYGLFVLVFTVNKKKEAEKYFEFGVDTVCSDYLHE